MKLRNKKTGEVFDALIREKGGGDTYSIIVCDIEKYSKPPLARCILGEYDSLAKLYEEWDDYKSVEFPRIMNEKSRNTIRAWAELNGFDKVTYEYDVEFAISSFVVGYVAIRFFDCFVLLENGKEYTIAELCGEEEE